MRCLNTSPPFSPIEPVIEILHGVPVTDPYRWLEDQDSPSTRAWIEEQVHYARAIWTAFPDANASASAFENSSPSKPMTPCKKPVAATSSESACPTKSSLAFTCVKVQTARIIF